MDGADGAVGWVYSSHDVVDTLSEETGMSGRIAWDHSKPNGQAYPASPLAFHAAHCPVKARGGMEDVIRAPPFELDKDCGRIEEVAVRPLEGDDVLVAFRAQITDERTRPNRRRRSP
jgi:hypothetical protein